MIFTLRPSSAPPPLVLMFQIAGACSVVQPNSSFTLRADDWCLLDTTPHLDISSFSPHNENLSLRLERPSDPELLSLIARGTGHRWRGATGVSRILETTVRETFRQMNTLRHASDSGLERGIAAIAWHAMREQLEAPVDAGHDAYQRSQIKAFIEAHLDDPELSVESIAQACGMSARSVHRAFESEPGGSVSNHIWMRRLARCADELRDPVRAHRPITELCFAWGFNSSSHFSRLFKEQFGVTPREYRDSSVRQQAPSPAVAAELS